MNIQQTYSQETIDKIGNTLIYLSENIPFLSKTKALKLLYILDAVSVKNNGIPFCNLKYEVWQFGPVAKDIFIELSDKPKMLADYIELFYHNNRTFIKPKKQFNDDEFTGNNIDLLNHYVAECNSKKINADDLVDFLHNENSLWSKTAKKEGLLELFNLNLLNSSNIEIDFSELLEDNSLLKNKYQNYLENEEFSTFVKSL